MEEATVSFLPIYLESTAEIIKVIEFTGVSELGGTEMDVMEAIKTRRSVRRFKPDAIPEDVMNEILEAARWAPSWANTQCWEFVVVKDQAIRTRLSEEALLKGNPAKRGVAEAPAVVVALAKEKVAGFYNDVPSTDKGDWFMYDVGVAMQNLCLAAWGFGLGTVHVGLMDAVKVEEILGVPKGVRVTALTPLGYPAVVGGSPPRKEIGDFVWKEKYGGR
jgi:nitroreductase